MLSQLGCNNYQFYIVISIETDELYKEVDSTSSDFLQRSLEQSRDSTSSKPLVANSTFYFLQFIITVIQFLHLSIAISLPFRTHAKLFISFFDFKHEKSFGRFPQPNQELEQGFWQCISRLFFSTIFQDFKCSIFLQKRYTDFWTTMHAMWAFWFLPFVPYHFQGKGLKVNSICTTKKQ